MYHSGPPDWGRDGPRGRAGFRGGYNDGPRGGPGARGPPPGPPGVGQQQAPQEAELVDREKTCPLLLRVFVRNGAHHKLEEFADRNKLPPESQVYTWLDAHLRELTEILQEVYPSARNHHARLSFAFVYPDRRGRNVMRQVGLVHASRDGPDDAKTLRSLGFQIGDYLDVAIQ